LINCKKFSIIKKTWDMFFNDWKTMIYAAFDFEYRELWNQFVNRYNLFHDECIDYLYETYIKDYRRRIIKCYINKILHFDITVTSRDDNAHALLKRQLEKSIDNLKTVMNEINLLLINELQNYRIDLDDDRIRYSMKLRKTIFQQLQSFVIIVALKKINSQYQMLIKRSIILFRCTNVFIITTELSCSHRIQKQLYQQESILVTWCDYS
jgi:hypothetical protein